MIGKFFYDIKICVYFSDNLVEFLYRGCLDQSFFNCGEIGIFFYFVSDYLSKKLGQWRYLFVWIICDGFVFYLEGMKIIIDYL